MIQRPRQDGFDFGGEPETVERLFIGLMLPPVAAAAATDVLRRSRADHELQGEAIRPDRLHVTLIHVGDYAGRLPGDVAQEFTPHVTLAYGDQRLADRPIDPIRWRAEEIVLIHSEVGRSTYHTLGRWPLA